MKTVERIQDLQGINVHAMLAHLVGGMQAQSEQIEALKKQNELLSAQLATLSK